MLREITSAAGLTTFTEIGLVIFVVTFTGIIVFALTRSRSSVRDQADLPNREARRARNDNHNARSAP